MLTHCAHIQVLTVFIINEWKIENKEKNKKDEQGGKR